MGLSPLLPFAGAALSSLTGRTLETVASGPSFLEVLQEAIGLGGSPTVEQRDASPKASPAELAEKLEAFTNKLQQRLAGTGIDASSPIEMKSDGRSGIILDNLHPDRASIEQILANDAELRADFHRLAKEITAASERYGSLTSHTAENFRLRFDQSGALVRLV